MNMRPIFFAIFLTCAAVVFCLLVTGCKEDDSGPVAPSACSIEVTSPKSGDSIMAQPVTDDSDDLLSIRWESAGGGNVSIKLYRGSELAAVITENTPNDGFHPWHAESDGLATGADYQVLIESLSSEGCRDLSPEFAVVDPGGCSMEARATWADPWDPVHEGDEMVISWESTGGSGTADLELWRFDMTYGHEYVGGIAKLKDTDSPYTWSVNAFGWQPSGSNDWYYVKVIDGLLEDCSDKCSNFELD